MPPYKTLPPRTDKCRGCPLYKHVENSCTHIPTQVQNPKRRVDLLVLQSHPTSTDDYEEQAFSGPGGQVFKRLLHNHVKTTGSKANIAYASAVRCRPVDQHGSPRHPTRHEVARCMQYTVEEIEMLHPKRILTLGRVAGAATSDSFYSVADARGPVKYLPEDIAQLDEQPEVVHSYHPDQAFVDPYRYDYLVEDISRSVGTQTALKWAKKGKAKLLFNFKRAIKFLRWLRFGLKETDSVAFDVETACGLSRTDNTLISIGFAVNGLTGYSIPLDHEDSPWTPDQYDEIKEELRRLFTEKVSFCEWLAWNATFDVQQVHLFLGVWILSAPVVDVMFLFWGMDENRLNIQNEFNSKGGGGAMALKRTATEWLRFDHWPKDILAMRNEGRLADAPLKPTCRYNSMDAYITRRVYAYIKRKAGGYWPKLIQLGRHIGAHAVLLISYLEHCGFQVDLEALAKLNSPKSPIVLQERKLLQKLRTFKEVQRLNASLVHEETGGAPLLDDDDLEWVFNPGKQEHLMRLFFDQIGVQPENYSTKNPWPSYLPYPEGMQGEPPGAPSIDARFWDTYASDKPERADTYLEVADTIHQLVELKKLRTAFVEKLGERLQEDPECWDGRVRAAFVYVQTVSGRLACRNPNLQQLPRSKGSEYKKAVKNLYVAAPGKVLVHTDYSQGEVYLLAQVAQDRNFAAVLWNMNALKVKYWKTGDPELGKELEIKADVHRQTAALMSGKRVQDIDGIERQAAKTIVFALIYGQAIMTLATNLKITEEEAEAKARAFFSKFPDCERWLEETEALADRDCAVDSLVGRRRRFPDLRGNNRAKKGRCRRQARNSPIQSLLSDITLYQAGRLVKFIIKHKLTWKVVNVIHDAILAEVPFQEVQMYIQAVRAIMMDFTPIEEAFGFQMIVPLSASADIGINFGEMPEVSSRKHLPKMLRGIAKEWRKRGHPIDELAQRRMSKEMRSEVRAMRKAA